VTVARDGSLLVSDDGAHRIWKIGAGGRAGTR
jgi:glucose/arabinose dehydrogenase